MSLLKVARVQVLLNLVFWIKRLIPGKGRQAFVNPEHHQELG